MKDTTISKEIEEKNQEKPENYDFVVFWRLLSRNKSKVEEPQIWKQILNIFEDTYKQSKHRQRKNAYSISNYIFLRTQKGKQKIDIKKLFQKYGERNLVASQVLELEDCCDIGEEVIQDRQLNSKNTKKQLVRKLQEADQFSLYWSEEMDIQICVQYLIHKKIPAVRAMLIRLFPHLKKHFKSYGIAASLSKIMRRSVKRMEEQLDAYRLEGAEVPELNLNEERKKQIMKAPEGLSARVHIYAYYLEENASFKNLVKSVNQINKFLFYKGFNIHDRELKARSKKEQIILQGIQRADMIARVKGQMNTSSKLENLPFKLQTDKLQGNLQRSLR